MYNSAFCGFNHWPAVHPAHNHGHSDYSGQVGQPVYTAKCMVNRKPGSQCQSKQQTAIRDRTVDQNTTVHQEVTKGRGRRGRRGRGRTNTNLKEANILLRYASDSEQSSDFKPATTASAQRKRINALNILKKLSNQKPADTAINFSYAQSLESLWKFKQCIELCRIQSQTDTAGTWIVFCARMKINLKHITPDTPAASYIVPMWPHELKLALYPLQKDLNTQAYPCPLRDSDITGKQHNNKWLSSLFTDLISTIKTQEAGGSPEPEYWDKSALESSDDYINNKSSDRKDCSTSPLSAITYSKITQQPEKKDRSKGARQQRATYRKNIVPINSKDHRQSKMQTLDKISHQSSPPSSESKTKGEAPIWNIWDFPSPVWLYPTAPKR